MIEAAVIYDSHENVTFGIALIYLYDILYLVKKLV